MDVVPISNSAPQYISCGAMLRDGENADGTRGSYSLVPADVKSLQTDERAEGIWRKLRRKVGRSKICRQSAAQNFGTIFPIFYWIRKYNIRKDLVSDFVAGLTVGTLAVPQALGYAVVAGVAPIFGLYTSLIPPLIYSLMGTSRHVSVGVFALVCLMTGEVTADVRERQSLRLVDFNATDVGNDFALVPASQVASTLAFAVGLWQLILGVSGLGFLTVYLSDRAVQGFACGAAFHIFNTQLKWIFGLTLRKRRGLFSLPLALWDFFVALPNTHLPTCLVSLACFTALIIAKFVNGNARVMKIIRFPIPMELLVIVFGSLSSFLLSLRNVYGVDIIQTVPLGLPHPQLPAFQLVPELLGDAFMIAIIIFSVAVSASRVFAQKHNYIIDSNQELRALGVANLVASFFQCIPCAVALARSAVQEAAGGVTQIVGIVSASLIVLVITVLGPLLEPVPKACLGCIVCVALSPMIYRITEVTKLWKISKLEALIFLVPCIAIIVLDVEIGLAIGVGFSLFAAVVLRTQMGSVQLMKTKAADKLEVPLVPGTVIIRINTPLYFANAKMCLRKVGKLLLRESGRRTPGRDRNNGKVELSLTSAARNGGVAADKDTPAGVTDLPELGVLVDCDNFCVDIGQVMGVSDTKSVKTVILDMIAVTFIDMTGVQVLRKSIKNWCLEYGCRFLLASCSGPVKEMLMIGGRCGDLPQDLFFYSVGGAVDSLST